ncbi:MAG TPA: tetratricopeptide repeat protein [Bacteroidia bacterium]|nr:tetratricopeptide repeat protein [Bacteroidia bacterium]
MSKKKPKKKISPEPEKIIVPEIERAESLIPLKNFKSQAIVIALIGFIFYANSLFNQYALDDGIVITQNDYVQEGISGIGKILSTDAYDSFYRHMNGKQQLSGGRYRPLSVITFAIEHQFFGENAFVRHLMNVLFYIVSCILLLYFLQKYLFANHRHQMDLAFLTTLLFTIHPIHTEVVANVKSCDEILSFLFIIATFIYCFRHQETRLLKDLLKALGCFFLALLSKEYAVLMIGLIPLAFYLTRKKTFSKSLVYTIPFFFILFIYLLIRFSVIGGFHHVVNTEVLNNPYLYASPSQKWATEIFILLKYLKLLIFPWHLSADYSYNQIPYKNFGDLYVWVSIFVYTAIISAGIILFKKRNVFAFAIAFYLGFLLMISNLIMDIGATMGERLIYHSSLGFTMAVAGLLVLGFEKINFSFVKKQFLLYGFLIIVLILAGFKTMERNAIWKNDITLFTHDVNVVPNSALANGNAGARYIDLTDLPENKNKENVLLQKAIFYLDKSLRIHPDYVNSLLNLGVAYYKLDDPEKADSCWNKAKKTYPNNPFLQKDYLLLSQYYLNKAFIAGSKKNYTEAIALMQKATRCTPNDAKIWYNLGGAYFTIKDYNNARQCWEKTLQLDPNYTDAKRGLAALPN